MTYRVPLLCTGPVIVDMTSLRVKLSKLSAKKVPLVSLVLVAVVGMVVGVLAASLTVNTASTSFTGQNGTLTANTGSMTVVDNGLSIVSTVPGSTNASATFPATGGNRAIYCSVAAGCVAFAVGHFLETLTFTDTLTDAGTHTVKITINSASAVPNGTTLTGPVTVTLTGPGSSSTGTITIYVDLGTQSITAPLTVYVTST